MSVWKTPDIKPDNDNDIVCLVGALPFAGYYEKFNASYVEHTTGENYTPDEIDRWCYLGDLIAQADKAERLQAKVDELEHIKDGWAKFAEQKDEQIQRLKKAVNTALISIGTAAILDGIDAKKYADAKIDLIKKLIKELK